MKTKLRKSLYFILVVAMLASMIPLIGTVATANDNVYPATFDEAEMTQDMNLLAFFDFNNLGTTNADIQATEGDAIAQIRNANNNAAAATRSNLTLDGSDWSFNFVNTAGTGNNTNRNNMRWLNIVKGDGTPLLAGMDSIVVTFDSRRTGGNWAFYIDRNTAQNVYQTNENYIGTMDNGSTFTVQRFASTSPRAGHNPSGNYTTQAGGWNQIAIVVRPLSTALYINGNLVDNRATDSDNFTLDSILGLGGGVMQLGRANWGQFGEYFQGQIDNFKVFGREAAPVERDALAGVIAEFEALIPESYVPGSWRAALMVYNAALAVYGDEAASQIAVDAAAANLRSAIDALVTDEGGDNRIHLVLLIASAPTDAELYTPATWAVFQSALEAANAVVADPDTTRTDFLNAYIALQDAIDGLRLYVAFGENLLIHYDFETVSGTTVFDSSGNNHHGTLFNNAAIVDAPGDNRALNLATGTQHLQMPQGFMTGAGVNNYTISLYIKQTVAQGNAWVLSLANSSSAGYLFIAPNTGGGNLRYALTPNNWNGENGINTPGLGSDRWHHIVARQSGNAMTLFLDGVQIGTANSSLRIGNILTANSNMHFLGRSAYAADPFWRGQISDFRIYDTAMSNEDIARLYDHLKIVDPFEISNVSAPGMHPHQVDYDHISRTIFMPVRPGTDTSDLAVSVTFDPTLVTIYPDPATVRDYSSPVQYVMTSIETGASVTYTINVPIWNNPVIPGSQADPEILAAADGKYYIYSTTCGLPGWGGHYFRVYSSYDLVHWEDEGIIIDVAATEPYDNHNGVEVGIVHWATGNAWAPGIIERERDGKFYYYFYFSGHNPANNEKEITVAISDSPTGPFRVPDHLGGAPGGAPMLTRAMTFTGQAIDPGIFHDPVSGDYFIYWGQSTDTTAARLNDDMISIDMTTRTRIRLGPTFREGIFVFYHEGGHPDGNYYFTWSEDDTGSPNYRVRWGVSDHPLGSNPGGTTTGNPSRIEGAHIMIQRDDANRILATGHHSILRVPGVNRWFINYHRFVRFGGAGHNRETCLDEFFFDANGNIMQVTPTLEGVLTPIRIGDLAVNVREAAAALEVFGIDDVRHNITLPESGLHNTIITWESSHPDVITDEIIDGRAPGIVTRPVGGDPIAVTLTATITDSFNGETMEQDFIANVTPIDPDLDKDFTAGYIWSFFNRTTLMPTGTSGTNNERYKIFYGYSFDGLHWNTLNRTGNTAFPIAESIVGFTGVRDPHIIRSYEGDKYWIIGTDLQEGFDQQTGSRSLIVWESLDMITWTDSRLELVFPYAGNVWAPEAYYDVENGDWLVYWASRDRRDTGNANKLRMYVSRTRDFKTFTDPIIWGEEPGVGHNLIDTSIMHVNGLYYRMHTSDWFTIVDYSPTLSTNAADWTKIMARGESDARGLDRVEGLTTYRLPDGRWVTMGDNPGTGGYRGFWIEEEDFHSQQWTRNATTGSHSRANTFRSGTANATFRHGTVMRLSAAEEQRLMAAMGAGWNYDPAPRYSTYVKNGTSNPMVTTEGGNVAVNYVSPGGGVTFQYWVAEGIELTEAQRTATTLNFAMPANDVRLYAITNRAVTSVAVTPGDLELAAGEEAALTVTVRPTDAVRTILWTSSDTSIATVDQDGKVTAVGPGTAVITAASTATPAVSGSAEVTVTGVIEPADYGAVNAAIQAYEALDKDTVRAGLAALEAAVEAVIWNLPIARQAEVDAFAAAINEAFDALLYWEPISQVRIGMNAITRVARNFTLEDIVISVNEEAKNEGITLAVSNPAMATIGEDGRSVITANRAGTVTLTATAENGTRHSVTLMIT